MDGKEIKGIPQCIKANAHRTKLFREAKQR